MERPTEESTDGSSIKPVSSLRSHFENLLGSSNKSPAPPPSPRLPTPSTPDRLSTPEDRRRTDGRISLDIPRESPGRTSTSSLIDVNNGSITPRGRSGRSPWSRPTSMLSFSPKRSPTRSPPKVTIQSPSSPPKSPPKSGDFGLHSPLPWRARPHAALESPSTPSPSLPPSNGARFFKIPGRNETPSRADSKRGPLLQSTTVAASPTDPRKSGPPAPPPVNRAGKPKILGSKSHSVESTTRTSLAPDPVADEERVSPFSTPPSSAEGSREMTPIGTDPSPLKSKVPRDSYFPHPPRQSSLAEKPPPLDTRMGFQSIRKTMSPRARSPLDSPEEKPGLPPRRDDNDLRKSIALNRPVPPEPPVRRSMDTTRPAPSVAETNNMFMPPPKRTPTLPTTERPRALQPPEPPPPRRSAEMKRPAPVKTTSSKNYDSDDAETPLDNSTPALTDYPDSSEANRRPPLFREGPREIPTKYDTKLFAICGEYICTTGYVTRVWSLLNGEMLMSLTHGETVKATSVAFRPAKDVEDEGKRLWIGTNVGELHEIDVPTQSVVYTKSNAHVRASIIKIFRYASEMWSLDDDGRIHIWAPDERGSPTLTQTPNSFRVPRGHTFSIISGSHLWVAFGKEIRVYQRTTGNNFFVQAIQSALSQPNAGEVTSGAILSSQPDRIYFGHIDGKVSIYSKKGFGCLGVVNVSLYKISSLVGVGDYLWAGYITGMIYVYDTSCTPWKVMKDWKAHENAIAGIVADRTSIWKLDRLQVASLGTDNMLRIWDGMMRDDWLESRMQQTDAEYCDFREVSVMVMTWNAGAVKPTALRQDEQDTLFGDLLPQRDPPDILVFGFQELVDLEDKKVTARSFFKKHKKKVTTDHSQHMAHQYRAWRDDLKRVIDRYMPNEGYTLLHTADLVGLFTCIFVKTSERTTIRDVSAAQVKLGMGGLHGNKGALVVRFFMDDSSICFINCHLAAGQSQTMHRNNDVATIMESEALPRHRSPTHCADFFVGGGDGSMVLDHEMCILNGDLNYRIDAMPRDTVIAAVEQGNLAKLLDRDQLLLSRKRNPGFRLRAFTEAPINFAPTYKYDVGTDNYDTSEKRRSPAWCDRLLYRGSKIKQLDYRRHDGVRVSDHRPVSGRFNIQVKTISTKRQIMAKEKCEAEFEQVKQRIARDVKHDYLVNVFGLSSKEALRLLK